MRRNSRDLITRKSGCRRVIKIGMGINSTISISKTIKITARRKNRMENGVRAERVGSNPHSNGDNFSRFLTVRVREEVIHAIINTREGIKIAVMDDSRIRFIYQKFKNSLMIKSHML